MKVLYGIMNSLTAIEKCFLAANKKIRNATASKIKGITFKSQTEKMIYRTLVNNGITPEYEKYTFTLWDGFTPITPFYDQETDKQQEKRNELQNPGINTPKILVLKSDKVVGIRYTPDFHFVKNNIDVWIEVKGFENDVFYIKKKMFRKFLDDKFLKEGKRSIFFEIYTKRQMLQALKIIEDYAESTTNN